MSIRKMYDAKQLKAKRNNTFLVDSTELYMEPGYNIRDGEIDQDKVAAFCSSFMADEYVPAIGVDITDKGLRVNDGQHRYLGAQMAIAQGKERVLLEVVDVTGLSEAKKVALMLRANDGTPTSNIKRAEAYARMAADGLNAVQIAEEVKRSPSDVRNMLALARCPAGIKAQVSAGSMSYVTALKLHADHGDQAEEVAAQLQEEANQSGKEKVTPKQLAPKPPKEPKEPGEAKPGKFPAAKALRIAELSTQLEWVNGDEKRLASAEADESLTLRIPAGVFRELRDLLRLYQGGEQ
ncbi:putative transcriptional regulator [Serratia phage MQ-4]|nr:putative transcriptional regulator [Serratia phage MQ-4]